MPDVKTMPRAKREYLTLNVQFRIKWQAIVGAMLVGEGYDDRERWTRDHADEHLRSCLVCFGLAIERKEWLKNYNAEQIAAAEAVARRWWPRLAPPVGPETV